MGSQLSLDGKPFYFIGTNAYWLIDENIDRQKVDILMNGAKGLGLKVVRTWAFNKRLPYDNGHHGLAYDETQFQILDYIVQSARNHGIKLILALGNLWPAYIGPEEYVKIATGSAGGKTVADFYSDSATRALYASHISTITARVNSYSKIAYRDDSTIMMWDIMNEPRCPGCTPAQLSVHKGWLYAMASHTKSSAPRQLVSPASEGYFMHSNVQSNPGGGSSCEGEDFDTVSGASPVDVASAHIYWRQTEGVPGKPGTPWTHFTFERYMQWFSMYLGLHLGTGKPLVIEEFNVQVGVQTEGQRNVLFQWLTDRLIASKREGGPLAGIMFWEGAVAGIQDFGYNIYMRRLRGSHDQDAAAVAPAPDKHNLPAAAHTHDMKQSAADNASSTPPVTDNTSGALLGSDSSRSRPRAGEARTASDLTNEVNQGRDSQQHSRRLSDVPIGSPPEELDPFRRFKERKACADSLSAGWNPIHPPQTVDVGAYMRRVAGKGVLDIIRGAAQALG
ncbi:MAG: hypothetical protein WDW36_007739 [Sanguina aurantia]